MILNPMQLIKILNTFIMIQKTFQSFEENRNKTKKYPLVHHVMSLLIKSVNSEKLSSLLALLQESNKNACKT